MLTNEQTNRDECLQVHVETERRSFIPHDISSDLFSLNFTFALASPPRPGLSLAMPGVSAIGPGAIPLTRMPWEPHSKANVLRFAGERRGPIEVGQKGACGHVQSSRYCLQL